jgi:hypothetical protein
MRLIDADAAIDALTEYGNGRAVHIGVEEAVRRIEQLPSAQPKIIYCKDCVKHNKGHGYYYDGTVIGIKDCCPLVEIRGRAQGHEFDYQFCAYAERRQDV